MKGPDKRTAADWRPDSWQSRQALQQPEYPDAARLAAALEQLRCLPPLVTSWEVEALREQLAAAQAGETFVLWGGDCAESFADCTSENIVAKLKILLQMSVVITAGLRKRVLRIGRMAGQYAKPRSASTESREGVELPSYRGDLVNRAAFEADSRAADPEALLRGYERAALTLNFVRSLIDGGFADLHHPENWDLSFVSHSASAEQYHRIVKSVTDSLEFFESITGRKVHQARRVDFYTSHEALHLLYEQAQTRFLEHRGRHYNLTTHLPWIGMRTAQPDGAHVEYCRGIANPVGIKVGTGLAESDLKRTIGILNPDNTPGRLTLIHRFGAKEVRAQLPKLIRAVRDIDAQVTWICDPMHGNTETASTGHKTRRFDNIMSELEAAFEVHREHDSELNGVHLELTGEHVTECIGGARGLSEADLPQAYRTAVDPRLNYEQAMEVAMRIADLHSI